VNPVTNKIYVVNNGSSNVTVIDGATNDTTTVAAGTSPYAVAVNPVTNKTYVANSGSDNVTVITDAPVNDTKVRAAFDRLPGDTTTLARPALTGKGVNRWTRGRTAMIGVGNRLGTGQKAWDWANVTSGAGTDSITWAYAWGTDSLIMGENFVCAVPLEAQAATTDNLGLGSPFAGNLEVCPVYRMENHVGREEMAESEVRMTKLPTIIRGVLALAGDLRPGTADRAALLDIAGRKVSDLKPGPNDVSGLAPGVYFVRGEPQAASHKPQAVRKVVVTR
jgi:YVTN family beta-propeller protein